MKIKAPTKLRNRIAVDFRMDLLKLENLWIATNLHNDISLMPITWKETSIPHRKIHGYGTWGVTMKKHYKMENRYISQNQTGIHMKFKNALIFNSIFNKTQHCLHSLLHSKLHQKTSQTEMAQTNSALIPNKSCNTYNNPDDKQNVRQ